MVKEGGTDDEAKKLAEEFQAVLLDVMFEEREIKEENDIIRAKALPGTKKKEPANLPHEFVTNDDFCPGCGLELKSQAPERGSLLQDVFTRHLRLFGAARARRSSRACWRSGALRWNAGWAPIAAVTSRASAPTSRRCGRRCRRSSPTSTASRTSRSRSN